MSARILIVNAVTLNVGDAAILEGAIAGLRAAFGEDAEIVVSDDDARAASRRYPDLRLVSGLHDGRRGLSRAKRLGRSVVRRRRSLGLWLWPRAHPLSRAVLDRAAREQLDRISAADIVIATGGTYLVEHYPIAPRLEELRLAQAMGKPTYLYTQSLGPFERAETRRLVAPVLRAASHVFLRDERSRQHALGLGAAAARTSVWPDAAFALCTPRPPSAQREPTRAAPAVAAPRVAVSVREWRRFREREAGVALDAYRQAVAAAVRLLHARGAEITFMSTCQGAPEYWTDDSRFARELVDAHLAGVERVRVDTAFRRPVELLEALRDFDLVIATRMHFAILALCAGVPVVPIAYEFKTAELFASLGMGELVEDIERIDESSLCARVESALDRLPELGARIDAMLPGLRRGAEAPARRIRAEQPERTVASGERRS